MKDMKRLFIPFILLLVFVSCKNPMTGELYDGSLFLDKISQMEKSYDDETGETLKVDSRIGIPSSVEASVGKYPDKVSITWGSVEGVSEYGLYRSGTPTGSYVMIGGKTVADTSFVDENVRPGETYYYKVRAFSSAGTCSELSGYVYGRALGVISLLTASDDDTEQVKLSWSPVSGAIYYQVWRCEVLGGDFKKIGRKIQSTTSADKLITGTRDNYYYYYKIEALNAEMRSAGLSDVSTRGMILSKNAPAPPKNIVATQACYKDKVVISWPAGSYTYKVNKSLSSDPGSGEEIPGVVTGNSYEDSAVISGVKYYYEIQAINGEGEIGKRSAPVLGYTMEEIASLDAKFEGDSVALSWASVPGVDGYLVERTDQDGTVIRMKVEEGAEPLTCTETMYTDTELTENSIYEYKVMPVKLNAHPEDASGPHEIGKFKKTEKFWIFTPPASLTSSAIAGGVSLSWDKTDGIAKYRIYTSRTEDGSYSIVGETEDQTITDKSLYNPGNKWVYGSFTTSDYGFDYCHYDWWGTVTTRAEITSKLTKYYKVAFVNEEGAVSKMSEVAASGVKGLSPVELMYMYTRGEDYANKHLDNQRKSGTGPLDSETDNGSSFGGTGSVTYSCSVENLLKRSAHATFAYSDYSEGAYTQYLRINGSYTAYAPGSTGNNGSVNGNMTVKGMFEGKIQQALVLNASNSVIGGTATVSTGGVSEVIPGGAFFSSYTKFW